MVGVYGSVSSTVPVKRGFACRHVDMLGHRTIENVIREDQQSKMDEWMDALFHDLSLTWLFDVYDTMSSFSRVSPNNVRHIKPVNIRKAFSITGLSRFQLIFISLTASYCKYY